MQLYNLGGERVSVKQDESPQDGGQGITVIKLHSDTKSSQEHRWLSQMFRLLKSRPSAPSHKKNGICSQRITFTGTTQR